MFIVVAASPSRVVDSESETSCSKRPLSIPGNDITDPPQNMGEGWKNCYEKWEVLHSEMHIFETRLDSVGNQIHRVWACFCSADIFVTSALQIDREKIGPKPLELTATESARNLLEMHFVIAVTQVDKCFEIWDSLGTKRRACERLFIELRLFDCRPRFGECVCFEKDHFGLSTDLFLGYDQSCRFEPRSSSRQVGEESKKMLVMLSSCQKFSRFQMMTS
jgi:hypothetical protein